jgi:porphobilinogen synthase
MKIRPRRLRLNSSIRSLCEETQVSTNDLIYPVFIKDKLNEPEEIKSMPDIFRHNIESLIKELAPLHEKGLKAIALFPVIAEELKSLTAEEAYNPEGLTQKTIRRLKQEFPELLIISDIALDPYTSHGHDGIIHNGKIENDTTLEILARMALAQAEAGADIVAPSDMMDGRIEAIRYSLESNNFKDTLIMSYTAKYASCLYGPFRDALNVPAIARSEATKQSIPKDKKTYQMNPANSKEALKELALDINEGADIVMVKPATWYLDIIKDFKQNSMLPVATYQVSGEYSMICAAAEKGYINADSAMQESLHSIKRAGADMILSYFCKKFLLENN